MTSRCVDLPLSTAYRTLTALEITHLAGVTFGRGDVTLVPVYTGYTAALPGVRAELLRRIRLTA
jgi:hypothetical protein